MSHTVGALAPIAVRIWSPSISRSSASSSRPRSSPPSTRQKRIESRSRRRPTARAASAARSRSRICDATSPQDRAEGDPEDVPLAGPRRRASSGASSASTASWMTGERPPRSRRPPARRRPDERADRPLRAHRSAAGLATIDRGHVGRGRPADEVLGGHRVRRRLATGRRWASSGSLAASAPAASRQVAEAVAKLLGSPRRVRPCREDDGADPGRRRRAGLGRSGMPRTGPSAPPPAANAASAAASERAGSRALVGGQLGGRRSRSASGREAAPVLGPLGGSLELGRRPIRRGRRRASARCLARRSSSMREW